MRSDVPLEEQVRRYATRLGSQLRPLTLEEIQHRPSEPGPTRRWRRGRVQLLAAAAAVVVALALVSVGFAVLRGDDSNRAVETTPDAVPRPTEPEPRSPAAEDVLEPQLTSLARAGFTGELYGTPGTIAFGGTSPSLPGYTILMRASTGTARAWAERQTSNEALDRRFRGSAAATAELDADGAYGMIEDPSFPEEWLARDTDDGVFVLSVLLPNGAQPLGREQLTARLEELIPQLELAGITPAAAAALPGGARIPPLPSPPSMDSVLIPVAAAEIPGYQEPVGFPGWIEGRYLLPDLPPPGTPQPPQPWTPVWTLRGELTGYVVPGIGFVGIDVLTTPGFSINELPPPGGMATTAVPPISTPRPPQP